MRASSVLLPVPPLDVSAAVAGAAVRFHVTTHAGPALGPGKLASGGACFMCSAADGIRSTGRRWRRRYSAQQEGDINAPTAAGTTQPVVSAAQEYVAGRRRRGRRLHDSHHRAAPSRPSSLATCRGGGAEIKLLYTPDLLASPNATLRAVDDFLGAPRARLDPNDKMDGMYNTRDCYDVSCSRRRPDVRPLTAAAGDVAGGIPTWRPRTMSGRPPPRRRPAPVPMPVRVPVRVPAPRPAGRQQ
ncbi:hypothetical protein CHLRE_01g055316v5 [Chlamydomonas reinhardtii]|uniref:Uncharacterized protein n=1 Tax=Chlamydomonas reinhardtii TaxID=3055 RepID=A0A2K3E8B9_CHLRE|nr:uncharacterized protein CHLRE_01g055316v5 [Chlamydomonas reinhardtii]XP_042928950.1 uncharacterized protein CHLRE_01g055316v5 [Chlamydomonas reinhardtii]PNW89026.1 hypothetical protein CHLRE_01g055316v5 [Chlamydomonas reinhardtii]PNW89027.1 hypothetical protein CHLRE_01g055316v5 [Chlamydomonas reinhardtii]